MQVRMLELERGGAGDELYEDDEVIEEDCYEDD